MRWTSIIQARTAGQPVFRHSSPRGATSQPTPTAQVASGWLAAMTALAPGEPRWKSSTAQRRRQPDANTDTNTDANRDANANRDPTVTPTPTPGQIVLTAQSRRTNGGLQVRLNWRGATTAQVDIYRNDAPLAQGGEQRGPIRTRSRPSGLHLQGVRKNSMNCSNEVTKRFGGQ